MKTSSLKSSGASTEDIKKFQGLYKDEGFWMFGAGTAAVTVITAGVLVPVIFTVPPGFAKTPLKLKRIWTSSFMQDNSTGVNLKTLNYDVSVAATFLNCIADPAVNGFIFDCPDNGNLQDLNLVILPDGVGTLQLNAEFQPNSSPVFDIGDIFLFRCGVYLEP